jgi:SNF2 family DNA or RNA helicase
MNLYPHQIDALEQTKDLDHVAYYLDMGLGKTFVGSEKMVRIGKRVNLLICQKSKVNDWLNHFRTHYSMAFTVINGTKEKMDFILKSLAVNVCPTIIVINYELAWRRPELAKLRDFTLMLDESSLIQNKTAKQTKFIINKLQPSAVILLSGTPCSGKYENLWTQAKLLGWDLSESAYLQNYVNRRLMDLGGMKFWKVIGYKNVDRLKEKFRQHGSIFLKTEDVIDLPQQTFTDILVDAPKEYKKFMKNGIITIDDVELLGDTQLTKRLRARQICSVYAKAKYEAFRDLLTSTNDRLIVFYNFTAECNELAKIAEAFDRPYSIISGQHKDLTAYEQYDDSITFVQYQAGAKGLNLQKANKIIYFSLTEKCEDWMQSQKRIHRIGQDRPCFYYIMKCRGTVEEKIHAALKRGVDYTDELFREEIV